MAQLNFRLVKSGIHFLCMMAALSAPLADNNCAEALPAGTGRTACRGLPVGLQSETTDEAVGVATAEGQRDTERIELDGYTPGQHVIVSVLEDSADGEAHSSPQGKRYILQAISVTGQPIGRFKAVTDTTKLHHCGTTLTVLSDAEQGYSGVVFAWLPPHEGDVQPVTIIFSTLLGKLIE